MIAVQVMADDVHTNQDIRNRLRHFPLLIIVFA
jgi:hypothetical protein